MTYQIYTNMNTLKLLRLYYINTTANTVYICNIISIFALAAIPSHFGSHKITTKSGVL